MPNTLWTVACGGTLHGRRRLRRRSLRRGIPPSRCRRCHPRTGLSLQTEEKEDPPGVRIRNTDIETFTAISIASIHIIDIIGDNNIVIKIPAWICFFENKEATTTITTIIIIIKRRRRKRKWTTVTAPPSSSLLLSSSSSPLLVIVSYRTGKKSIIIIIIIIASTEIASRAGTPAVTSYSSPGKGKEEEEKETTGEGEVAEDSAFLLVVSSFSSSLLSSSTLSLSSSPVTFATIGHFRGDRVLSKVSPRTSPSSSSPSSVLLLSSSFTSSLVGWNPRHLPSTAGDDDDNNNNNKIFTYNLVIKFKLRSLLLSLPSSSSTSPRYGPYYYYIVIVVYFIVVTALKRKLREKRIHHTDNNNINKNHNVTVIFYHNWFLSIGMPRPLDDEFSYEPPGKKNRSSDSTDSTGSSTTSSRKEAPVPKMPKSPRGNQKAASTDMPTIVPKSDIRRAQFKGSKSMPAVDTSSPEPIISSTKEAEEVIEMSSSTGRPAAETTNLHLKYLLQVTDSELQNMSREIPSSQTMSMGVPSGGNKPITNTQLVFTPVTTRDIIKIPVSEKGVEKYHVKSDSLEQQGLQLVYTKPTIDNQEGRPVSYVAFKPHPQHQSTEKSLQQQQSMTGDATVGRKRKHPQKQGRHICPYCGRGWAKPSVLEKHIRSHTNERPFPCAKCGQSFKTKSNLSKHTKSRIHALKAGLNQSASSTSSETAGTEGDVDAKDTNESEETQTETSDTDGENEDDSQKLRKDMLSVPESRMRLMRGNSAPEPRLGLEEFKDKKYLSSKESLLLGDSNLSVTTVVATAGGSGFGGASTDSITKESSDNVQCRMFGGDMSKSQHIEIGHLQHSSTPYTPVYLAEKKFYVTKPHESRSASEEGKFDEHSLSSCETTNSKSCLVKENPKITKIETSDVKLGTAWSKDNVPLSVSGMSLPNKLHSSSSSFSSNNQSQEQPPVKEFEELKPVSSLILSGVPTPSTKEMVEKRISQLISDNDSIVNTPMKEPPRQKRIFRQSSDPPTSHTPKLDDLPQSSSMSKVSIPSIASIPLTPIPGETDLRKDTSNSPKPFLVSDKYNSPNVNLGGRSHLSSLAPSPAKVDQLGEKINSGGSGHSNEIKIEIKLSKVANLVATTANQTIVGQPNIQYMPAAPTMTSAGKNPENSVIKGLLMKGKTLPPSFSSSSHVKAIKEKSSSVDDISKIKGETFMVSPPLRGEVGTSSSVELSVGSKSSQLHKMHLCHSGPPATNLDPQIIFEPEFHYEQMDRPKLDKCSSTERDSLSGSFSQSFSSDHESSNDVDIERGERFKDERMDSTGSLLDNSDLTLPKKKGRPKGSKNKPKLSPSSSLQLQCQPSPSTNTSTLPNQQTPILLATLKKKTPLVSHSTLTTTTTTVSAPIIGQPMVSVQNSWTQPSFMVANSVSSPSTPTKLRLKGKILLKHSSSSRIQVQSQERDPETVSIISSAGSTSSVKDSSANLALLWTSSSLDDGKQPTDRNSPLKKRKVRTSEHSDTVIRPGVTRAGSEPLMSRMGQSWSGNSSMKLCAEKRLSSLPETYDYKPMKTLPCTVASVITAPVTVPVVTAEPIGVPMRFFDSIQNSAVKRDLVPLPAYHLPLPTIPSSSVLKQDKEGPAISGLVSFLLRKEFKCDSQESQEEVESSSKYVEESLPTNAEGLSSAKMFQSQADLGISSRSSSLVQDSPGSQSATLPKTTTTDVSLIHKHLYGHSVNSLRGLTHTTLCCVQQVQPMYVAQGDNHKISMYSNWRISQPSQDPGSLTSQMLISLYNSKEFNDPIFVVSSAKSCEVSVVDSRKWSLYNKQKTWQSSSYSLEKLSNGIFNIYSTKPDSSKLMLDMKLPSEDKDISHASGGSMESTPSSLGIKDGQSMKQPKRVRIFQGGFRSNEDYIYIRGRGRGKYVCEECGIRCKKPSMLKKHIRTHTDLRPYHCRHCRLSFKTKGNLTKHMKSKAHQKKCLELGITPVPVTVDESQIDSVALAAQSAIAKDTKILDDDNEDDEEDDKDMDDGEETDDADGQFSDSEESARTSFERMDIAETIDMSVDKESECGTPAQTSSIDVAETCRMPEVHSCELSEPEGLTTAEMTKNTTSNPATGSSHLPVSLKTLTTINAPHRQGATSQLQFVKEIAHSLLDLAQRQIPLAEEFPPDHLDATDSVILITTTTTSTATNTTTITTASNTITSTTTATAVSIQSKAEATEKTLKRQYSFDMDDSPDRGFSKSPTPQMDMPDIPMQLMSGDYYKTHYSVLKQTSSEEIAMINQQADIVENSSHKEMRVGEMERIGSQLLTHPSMVALKIDSQEGYRKQSFIPTAATAKTSDQPLSQRVYLVPDIPANLQSTIEKEANPGATSTSTLSLSLTGLLPHAGQLVKKEESGDIGAGFISHPQNRTPFQFQHSFQEFRRSSNNRTDEERRDESQTVITPLTTSGTEESTYACSPKTVSLSQSQSRESTGMEMIVCNSEATSSSQQGQVLLSNQQNPNNPSVVSIIVSNQPCRNFENIAQQPHPGHKQQSLFVSNSPNVPQVVTPTQQFNTNLVVEPQLVENLIPEQSQTRQVEFQPVSLIMGKPATESKLLVTRQSPTAIFEKTFHSEQRPASFERQSPKLYVDNSQTRSAYGNGQTRVHVERRIPMLEVQPMIPNVQLPPQEVGKLSPIQRLGSLSPTRQYVGRLSPKRQHMDRLSPTRQHMDRLSPTRQHVDRLSPTRQHMDRLSPTRQHVDRLSPTRQHVDRLSPTRQHVDRLSPTRQHVDRLSPTRQHVDRLSPTRQHVDMLSPTRHRVDSLSPTRQNISALSPQPHVDTMSSSNQSMEMLSHSRQSMIDRHMARLSPSKKLSGERLSPTQQYVDNLSPRRQPSPTSQPIDRRSTFQVSPTRSFRSQSPTHVIDKLSPTRLTDKPPFRRQTNRLSPSRHTEGLSSMHQLDRLSPTRQTERISPSRYENLSPTRVQARLSPCRPDQPWPSDSQLPPRVVETQHPIEHSEGQPLCMTAESQPTVLHKVSEKQQSTGLPESQISPLVSRNQRKPLQMQASVEEPSPSKEHRSTQPLTLQKSFKDDLNKCRSCNKCFSNTQEYMEHKRQHMKTQTHHSQDSSCGHSRPHLHKCFHSEGHADSRSMSTEEIPRPPDCENCKMDFWKQNHLPKHLWVKKHLLTMRNKNSSSTDSESAAPSEVTPDTVVTSTSVSAPSRVKTIQGTEKALDLSIDESAVVTSLSSSSSSSSTCVTATCTTVTSVTTTAAVTVSTTTVMPEDMVRHNPALMIADTRCIVSREQAAIMNADISDPSSFFIHQRALGKKYIDPSNEEVKSETVEAEIPRSDIRNPATYYFVTGDENEITGANVIPITPVAPHATHACHICPRTFTSAYQLKNHLSHIDSRPYVCEYCDAGFSKEQTLHIHLQMHSQQERPYICGTCGDTFVTSENLKQHLFLHSDGNLETHRSFDESALHSYQQGTRIGSPLPKVYDRGVHMATSQLCSQDPFSTSFPSMISTPVQVSAMNIQQKQLQYRLSSSQPQQYMEIGSYGTGDTGPVMVTSTLTALALDSVVSKP